MAGDPGRTMRATGWRWIAVAAVAIVLATACWRLRDVPAQDACLDAGGAWRDGACRR